MNDQDKLKTANKNVWMLELDQNILTCYLWASQEKAEVALKRLFIGCVLSGTPLCIWKRVHWPCGRSSLLIVDL